METDTMIKPNTLKENSYTWRQILCYKIDRNLAIAGIIVIALGSYWIENNIGPGAEKLGGLAIGALATFLGVRAK